MKPSGPGVLGLFLINWISLIAVGLIRFSVPSLNFGMLSFLRNMPISPTLSYFWVPNCIYRILFYFISICRICSNNSLFIVILMIFLILVIFCALFSWSSRQGFVSLLIFSKTQFLALSVFSALFLFCDFLLLSFLYPSFYLLWI